MTVPLPSVPRLVLGGCVVDEEAVDAVLQDVLGSSDPRLTGPSDYLALARALDAQQLWGRPGLDRLLRLRRLSVDAIDVCVQRVRGA